MTRLIVPCFMVLVVCWSGSPSLTPPTRLGASFAAPQPELRYDFDDLETALRRDPVACFGRVLDAYRAEVRTASFTCVKRERVDDRLEDEEEIEVSIRERPYAVRMVWKRGAKSVAGSSVRGLVYVAGENGGRMTVWRPQALASFLRLYDVSPTDASARRSSRYSPTEAGLGHTLQRTLVAWSAARQAGTLDFEFQGRRAVLECGGVECFVLKRTCSVPERDPFLIDEPRTTSAKDGSKFITIHLDAQSGRQVGAEMYREDGSLLGSYFFKNVIWNPKFAANEFNRSNF